jgi:hypothetical protein
MLNTRSFWRSEETINRSQWIREQSRCKACKQFHTRTSPNWYDRHDRCIRNLPHGLFFACCGHGEQDRLAGYFYIERGTIRFPGDVHPFLIRAALNRFVRNGYVPGWGRQDSPRRGIIEPLGTRFRTSLDRRYRQR